MVTLPPMSLFEVLGVGIVLAFCYHLGFCAAEHNAPQALGTVPQYVTIELFSQTGCQVSDRIVQEIYATNTCFVIVGATDLLSYSAMYVWNADNSGALILQFYVDTICLIPTLNYNTIISNIASGDCLENVHVSVSESFSTPSNADGVQFWVYPLVVVCETNTNQIQMMWFSTEFIATDDFKFPGFDDGGFGDDSPKTCSTMAVDVYNNDQMINFTQVVAVSTTYTRKWRQAKGECFANSETVSMADGEIIPISKVVVGDRILAADDQRRGVISTVISVPHASDNNDKAMFTQLFTESGNDIKLTPDHLILVSRSCVGGEKDSFELIPATEVRKGMCLWSLWLNGFDKVAHINPLIEGIGVHTLVTDQDSEYLVVNGLVASPFAHNHAVALSFHRSMRILVPDFMKSSSWVKVAIELLGGLAVRFRQLVCSLYWLS